MILRVGGPLIVNNLAIAGMNLTDTVMAGHFGARDLAAVAVGSSVWNVAFLLGLGILMAMSPTAAHAFGAGERLRLGHYARQGAWLSQLLAWGLFMVLGLTGLVLRRVGVDETIIPITIGYVDAIAWGLPGIYLYLSLRFTSEGIGWTRPVMYIAAAGLLLNILANYVFMFGKLGFPAMGAVGCGWASALVMWIMLICMLLYVKYQPVYRPFEIFKTFEWPSPETIREILTLGIPIGISVLAEAGLFSTVAVLMGTLGADVVAAHQIAINYAATMFMLPLAIHSATTVRVGQRLGRGNAREARRIGFVGIALAAGFMVISALVMLLFKESIVALYTRDTHVQQIAVSLLVMAAVFQVSDGLQVGAAGALRGFKDTRVPMWLNFCSYWLVGFPLAYYLGLVADLGPQSVWVGLVVGLTLAAALLNRRYWVLSRSRAITDNGVDAAGFDAQVAGRQEPFG